jgi:hypothetical protein
MRADIFESLYKDGDIIMVRRWIVILKGLGEPIEYFPDKHTIIYYAVANIDSDTCVAPTEPSPGIGWVEEVSDDNIVRLATNKEKRILFDRLYRKGIRWDETSKRLIFLDI